MDGNPVPSTGYFYTPNIGAAIVFAVAFSIAGLGHLWQCYHMKCFTVTMFLPFACALLTAAFATRAYASSHPHNPQVYTASTMLLYLAPPLIQYTNLHILSRLFRFIPYFAPVHPAHLVAMAASLAGVIILLTVAGIAYLTNHAVPDRSVRLGDTLTRASLVLQAFVACLSVVLAGVFHRCCAAGGVAPRRVTRPLAALYASTLLLLGRAVFRMVEHFGPPRPGQESVDPAVLSPAQRHEWMSYVFDAALVLAAVALWNVWHPFRFLPRLSEMYLAQDGVTVLKGPGWKRARSLTESFFNPFAMLSNRGGHHKQFWEQNGYSLRTQRRAAGRTAGRAAGRV